jgi:hypothetical protein
MRAWPGVFPVGVVGVFAGLSCCVSDRRVVEGGPVLPRLDFQDA